MSASRTHELKLWPAFFDDVESGAKPFELRFNDRGYQKGDILDLREWRQEDHCHTGRKTRKLVTYVCQESRFGLAPGYCVLGLAPLPPEAA